MSGGMITLTSSTNDPFAKTRARIEKLRDGRIFDVLDRYGQEGVIALAGATPVRTGLSSASWSYEVKHENGLHQIIWHNSNMAGDTPVVILLQYGHGTGTGGYVVGRDFINPVILPLFERIKADMRKAVSSA